MTDPVRSSAIDTHDEGGTMSLPLLNDYVMWGDARLVRVLRGLSDQEFDREFGDLTGTVRSKTAHILSIYEFFIAIFEGRPHPGFPDLSGLSKDELLARWEDTITRWPGYLERFGPDALFGLPLADGRRVETRHIVTDALLHTAHHRGQLLTMIRLLGKGLEEVPSDDVNLDYLKYLFTEHPEMIHPAGPDRVRAAG